MTLVSIINHLFSPSGEMSKGQRGGLLSLLLFTFLSVSAQMVDPVKFSAELKTGKTADAEIVFSGKIDKGWHVYSTNLGQDGPIEATFNVVKLDGVELVGSLKPQGKEVSEYDEMFGMTLRFFENSVKFVQKIRFTKPSYTIDCYLNYGACNDQMCMPPTDVNLRKSGKSPLVGDAKAEEFAKVEEEPVAEEAQPAADSLLAASDSVVAESTELTDLWTPVIDELNANSDDNKDNSLWKIFLLGLAGGFIALLTPCVWPIIPMTVSFFLKRASRKEGEKKGQTVRTAKGVKDAMIYGVSIIVIYLTLGLVVTGLLGASALNALSTNALFNIFFCLLLVVFGASFLGGFEITLPSKWNNAVDGKATETSGLLSIFLMAFTLSLVSFSCTGPIIGFLLVEMSTSGNIVGPAVGMFGFALALALPFTLFAIFPTWLKSTPKSGNWMNVIKVTLGFVELAFALKFLSVADLAYGWHILDREVFLSLWIVLFSLLGAYLIGWIRFPHDEDEYDEMGNVIVNPRTSITRFFMALASFAFAVYMIPGLWGAPCKAVSAFAPPMNTQDFNLNTKEVHPHFTNYEEGMEAARKQGKPVFLDFTGFGCVNCRKMEAAVWTDPTVADKMQNDFIIISLFVDDKTPLPQPVDIIENGQERTLRTVGDKWSYLQRSKFGANAQPFYVCVNAEGHPLSGSFVYKEDVPAFLDFLNKATK